MINVRLIKPYGGEEPSKDKKEKTADPEVAPQLSKELKDNNKTINDWQTSPQPWDEPVDGEGGAHRCRVAEGCW